MLNNTFVSIYWSDLLENKMTQIAFLLNGVEMFPSLDIRDGHKFVFLFQSCTCVVSCGMIFTV